jgi:hypothetical protein
MSNRKTKLITVPHEGRDKGKLFHATEMFAIPAHEWATQLLMAMVEAGVDLPDDIYETGMAGIAAAGFRALLTIKFTTAKMLMDEMLACVRYVPDPKNPAHMVPMGPETIEEVRTVMFLQSEVFELHTGFSVAGALSHLTSLLPVEAIKNISTSLQSSASSSVSDSPPTTN